MLSHQAGQQGGAINGNVFRVAKDSGTGGRLQITAPQQYRWLAYLDSGEDNF